MKKTYCISECCKYIITPAIENVGWKRYLQISFYEDIDFAYKHLNTEYVLYYKPNIPIAVISVTENNTNMDTGVKIAINNAELLDVPCAFSSNGKGFTYYNRTKSSNCTITNISIDNFPTPDELWQIYLNYKNTKAITLEIESVNNNGFTRLLVGLLNASVNIISIIFRILDNLFSTSTDKRILYLADRKNDIQDSDVDYWQNTENEIHNIQEEDGQSIDIRQYPGHPQNVWINNKGNISVYQTSMDEFVGLDKSPAYKQYPSDFFDLLLLDINKKETTESELYQAMLNHFTDTLQVAIKLQNNITQFDKEYFGEPHIIDTTKLPVSSNKDYTKKNDVSTIESKSHINNYSDEPYQHTISVNENLNHNTNNTIKIKNIINNKITINTTIMARQTSFQHQIELAEDLKAYLIRLQENLDNAAKKYHDKTNSLYDAGMMDEKHQVLEEYMFETVSRIKSIVEQINESDIPFVDSWINYLEESQSIK